MRRPLAVQLDGNMELPELLQRLFEMHLAALDVEALGFERVSDIRRRDGSEEVIVLADLALEDPRNIVELPHESLSLGLLLRRLADSRCLHLLDHGLVRRSGFH